MVQATPTAVRSLRNAAISEIACGWNFSMVVDVNGNVHAFGRSDFGQCGTGNKDDVLLPAQVATVVLRARVCESDF